MAKNKYENLSEAEITALESRRLERKIKRRSEIKAFIILLLIVLIAASGTWYWYTHVYDSEKNKKAEEENKIEYEIVKYDATKSEKFTKVGDYFILTNLDNELEKIYDKTGKEYDLSKNNKTFTIDNIDSGIYLGIDNNLYLFEADRSEYGCVITLYKFDNGEFKKETELEGDGFQYAQVLYDTTPDDILIGFAGIKDESDGETDDYTFYYYIVGKKVEKTKEFQFAGDYNRDSETDYFMTISDTYITTAKGGLVNYKTNEVVIEDYYDGLYTTQNNNYIACKDDKCGLIDTKQKPLTEMVYDFIDARDREFYIVSKDNKLAIMDLNYKVISDYSILYNWKFTYKVSGSGPYYIYEAYKVGSTYYITGAFNIDDYTEIVQSNGTKEFDVYQVTKDGKVTKIDVANQISKAITTNKVDAYYSYDKEKKEATIYDVEKAMYTIENVELEDDYLYINILDDNNLQIGYTDSKYYDYKTGKEIEKPQDYIIEDNGLKIDYNYDESTITIKTQEENTYNIDNITKNNIYKNEDNYYIVSKKYLIFINNKGK